MNNSNFFTFGGLEQVGYDFLEYVLCHDNGVFFETPINLYDLNKLATSKANPYHPSALQVKKNILVNTFIPTKYLSRRNLKNLPLVIWLQVMRILKWCITD